ncbi:AbrB family transcriptional regulator [Chelativorans sp. AA-79]|uniref:AbrB family transcriptional regulator n=1 Tax=Chelativorans sp. AA-79 TaxID=3028735 RepID=UPI0023F78159|nr:AbrB family transcriptional regulator [Chelativorans sp. AA-79]WEX07590.1 AbrB family transcriptional regulator [Chelativorans sp. AA-79]
MDAPASQQTSERLEKVPPALQWLMLLLLSALFAGLLELLGLPAAALIGPMMGGAVMGINGAAVRVPKPAFALSQGVIGILIAMAIELDILAALADEWPLFLGIVLCTVTASSFLGWLISRWGILPGSTAVWGSAPGAATAMVLMAAVFGADQRLVAFMQYLRVMMVALAAAVIAGLVTDGSGTAREAVPWFPSIHGSAFALTLAVVVVGTTVGRLLRLPSPFFLGSMILGIGLHLGGGVQFQLPPWLLVASYSLIGWAVGLNFTRPIIRHALRALPQIIGSILVLMAFCGVLALLLNRSLGIDLLSAYLATSPGGMDSVAIIAAASKDVNMSFIMAMQMARFLFVLLFGPAIARFVAKTVREQR